MPRAVAHGTQVTGAGRPAAEHVEEGGREAAPLGHHQPLVMIGAIGGGGGGALPLPMQAAALSSKQATEAVTITFFIKNPLLLSQQKTNVVGVRSTGIAANLVASRPRL